MATRTAVVNVRMEPEVKEDAALVFSEAGLSFSDAVNAFCRESIRRQSIPFRFTARKSNPVDVSRKTSAELWKDIKHAEKQTSVPFTVSKKKFEQEHSFVRG